MAVIDLDLDAPLAPPEVRPPIHLLRPLGLALSAVLLLAVGGAAPVRSALWRPLGVVPLGDEAVQFELIGDHLFAIENPAGAQRDITAWSLRTMREDWTSSRQMSDPDEAAYGRVRLAGSGGRLLVQDESFTTTIVDPDTGTVRWTADNWPAALGDGLGLIQESRFRPGTEYDRESGDPGALYWSAGGQPHTEPARATILHGVDLGTGERRWTVEAPGSVYATPIDGGTAVLVVATDRMTVLDRDTGKVLRERPVIRRAGDADVAWVEVEGDLILLRRGLEEEAGTFVAYGTDTLERRWEMPAPPVGGPAPSCAGLICRPEGDELVVLDPRTGRPAWRAGPDRQLNRRGGAVLEMEPLSSRVLRVRDPATGAVRGDVSSWEGPSAASTEPDQPLIVTRTETIRKATAFGVLRPATGRVQPLGYAGDYVFDCLANDRYVGCRVPAGVEVWAYRA